MKKTAAWLTAGALLVSGCAVIPDPAGRLPDNRGFDPLVVRAPRATLPNVFVANGHLVVDQEPIRLWRSDYDAKEQTVRIAWALAADADVAWPDPREAISFSPEPKGKCVVLGAGRKVLECTLAYQRHTTYKYTLRVRGEKIKPPPLDPNIVNME
jgi:hypothetical protein